MKGTIVGWLQLALSLAICAFGGAPQTTFSSLQYLMLKEHLYEDRCKVTSETVVGHPLYCRESRAAYANVYNAAGLGFAIAFLPAFFSAKFGGYAFTNLICCLSLAAGSVILTDNSMDQWLDDRMLYGYTLVAVSAPFAVLNYLNALSTKSISSKKKVGLIFVLFGGLLLSPLIWSLIMQSINPAELSIHALFRIVLLISCILLLITMILVLFTTNALELDSVELIRLLWANFAYSVDKDELIALLDHDDDLILPEASCSYVGFSIFGQPFLSLLLAYLANSTTIDMLYLSVEAKVAFHSEVTVGKDFCGISSIIAALMVPILYIWTRQWGLQTLATTSYVGSLLLTFGQYLHTNVSWIVTSFTVSLLQSWLVWSTVLCVIKSSSFNRVISNATLFLLSSALIKWLAFTTVELTSEFNPFALNINPYLTILVFQVILSWVASKSIKKEVVKERRRRLELEAERAFNRA